MPTSLQNGSKIGKGIYKLKLRAVERRLDQTIKRTIVDGQTPGIVLCVGTSDEIIYFKAFGHRRLIPNKQFMRLNTIFDLASVTKIIATTPSICLLWQQGKLDLFAPVKRYLPEFSGGYKDRVSILHLLTHSSGLPAFKNYLELIGQRIKDNERRRLEIVTDICRTRLKAPPGKTFIYSDLGFILLGEIVHRVSGLRLDEFCRHYIYTPLQMARTRFNPPKGLHSLCGATSWRKGVMLQGVVHDPNSFTLNGVAGHAGLFSTADDLAKFCQMLLRKGEFNGVHVFEPSTVQAIWKNHSPIKGIQRGLGFDIQSPYSLQMKGDKFPLGVFGHTGYTGTSVTIDPFSKVFIVLLTNRIHPDDTKQIAQIRIAVTNLIAEAIYS